MTSDPRAARYFDCPVCTRSHKFIAAELVVEREADLSVLDLKKKIAQLAEQIRSANAVS